jgi:hypothetical protein
MTHRARCAAEPVTKQRGGWLIQVGALPDETEARQRLENARSKAKDASWQG